MICAYCGKEGAEMHRTTEAYGKGEKMLVIENVPVIRCRTCGEAYLTAETLHHIEAIRNDAKAIQRREVNVALYAA
ncbi:MAG: YgiT-type zinc finger protein [Calditrichaeota bacterium]|nr:YgiT-type zinc finger protein [Calditrichota bacterium]